MAFTKDQLLLSDAKQAQLAAALSNVDQADPLQFLCDEAAADVARLTTGYVLDANSLSSMTRALALYRIYSIANVPAPKDVADNYKSATTELEAIASGKRPNLPKVSTPSQSVIAGSFGSKPWVPGRMCPPPLQ